MKRLKPKETKEESISIKLVTQEDGNPFPDGVQIWHYLIEWLSFNKETPKKED